MLLTDKAVRRLPSSRVPILPAQLLVSTGCALSHLSTHGRLFIAVALKALCYQPNVRGGSGRVRFVQVICAQKAQHLISLHLSVTGDSDERPYVEMEGRAYI
jgi:hypothetical protein